MALKACPECNAQVSTTATACPQCGKKLKRGQFERLAIGCLLLVVGFVALGIIFQIIANSTSNEPPDTSPEAAAQQKKEYEEKVARRTETIDRAKFLLQNNIVQKWQCDGTYRRAYLNRYFWDQSNIDVKKGMAITLRDYCAQSQSGSKWIELYDYQSGKKLASLDSWGFKVH